MAAVSPVLYPAEGPGTRKKKKNKSKERSVSTEQIKHDLVQTWLQDLPAINIDVNPEKSVKNVTVRNNENPNNIHNLDLKTCVRRQVLERNLPYFNGNSSEWLIFINEYYETTEMCRYSDMENLVRLRKCLKGEAKEAVKMLLISYKNVPEILEALQNLYGRPEYIIKSLMREAKMIPNPKDYKPESLIKYANAVNNLVTAVKHLDSEVYLRNPQLLEEFVNNLSINYKQQWAFHAINLPETTLSEFAKWLKEVGKAAGLLYSPIEKEIGNVRKQGTILTTTSTGRSSSSTCLCCGKISKHPLEKCYKFKNFGVEERWKLVQEQRLCISCLKPRHRLSDCRQKKNCGINNCIRQHNQILHKENVERTEIHDSPTEIENRDNESVQIHKNHQSKIILRTVPVILESPLGSCKIHALLDEGSTVTLLEKEVADSIGLQGIRQPLCMQWTNDRTQTEENSRKLDLRIKGDFSSAKTFCVKGVHTVENLSLPRQCLNMETLKKEWPHLKNVPVKSLNNVKPTMLIGTDNYDLTMPRSFIEYSHQGPKATLTKLGWVINGSIFKDKVNENFNFHICEKEVDGENEDYQPIHQLVKNFLALDEIGINNEQAHSKEDTRALEIMKRTTKRIGNRFEIGLLWKGADMSVPESRRNAFNRLRCQEKKMDANKEFATAYCDKIQEYIKKGYLKKVEDHGNLEKLEKVWYLPHFAVFNVNKPGKLRLVFDAAAKSQNISLNDMLVSGPDLLSPLLNVLWLFRQKKIAFSGDIREMFHQVKIREEDRRFQRLLWRGSDRKREPDILEMQVMTFGATCSPSSAQYVKNLNAKEFRNEYPLACNAIIKKHYVDDYLDSCDTEKEAIKLIEKVVEVHKRGGFEIAEFISSSKEVLLRIPENLRQKDLKAFNLDSKLPVGRVLGMRWDPEEDQFIFILNEEKISNECVKLTKRNILKIVVSIFDPLGFLGHLLTKGRILLQEIWRSGIGWDDEIPENLKGTWKNWLTELMLI